MNNNGQDKILLEGLASQNKESIELIYKANYKMIQNLILNNKGTIDDAADIFQESMIVLYEKALNPDFILTCQLKTFIYSVCKRLWLKKLQQQQRFISQTDDFNQVVSVDEDLDLYKKRQASFDIMEQAMAKIGVYWRLIILKESICRRSLPNLVIPMPTMQKPRNINVW